MYVTRCKEYKMQVEKCQYEIPDIQKVMYLDRNVRGSI